LCQNFVAHDLFGGAVDLDDLPWVDPKAFYCHDNCKKQASEIRTGKVRRPRRLASPPPGWGVEPAKVQCDCKFSLEDLAKGNPEGPALQWADSSLPICTTCKAPASPHRIVFGSDARPSRPTAQQLARLIALTALQQEATRRHDAEQRNPLSGRRQIGSPVSRSTSSANVGADCRGLLADGVNAQGQPRSITLRTFPRSGYRNPDHADRFRTDPSARPISDVDFLRGRREERERAACADPVAVTNEENAAIADFEVPVPLDDEVEAAHMAHDVERAA
jgi:hypothetical protein